VQISVFNDFVTLTFSISMQNTDQSLRYSNK